MKDEENVPFAIPNAISQKKSYFALFLSDKCASKKKDLSIHAVDYIMSDYSIEPVFFLSIILYLLRFGAYKCSNKMMHSA